MAILRDLSYARTRSNYVPKNVNYIDQLGARLEQDYSANKDKADLLLNTINNLKVRNVNTPILEESKTKAKAALEALAAKGDYENSDLELRQLARDLNDNPLLQGAVKDYKDYEAYKTGLGELKDVGADRKDLASQYSDATNNQMLEYDPVTGYKNSFSGYTPNKTIDLNTVVGKFAEQINASEGPIEIGKDVNGKPVMMGKANNGYYVVGKKEAIGEEEAMQIITAQAANNPEVQAYLKENLMFNKFRRKYNKETGKMEDFTMEDVGGAEALYNDITAAGLDPNDFQTSQQLEGLYDKAFLESSLAGIAAPYAAAVSYDKTTLDYKANTEWLNQQQAQLARNNALAKLKAEEASKKRLMDYKYKKDAEKEERANGTYALSNPVESEAVNLALAEKSLVQIDADLKLLTAKKEAAKAGGTNNQGSPITFSPEENAKLISLQSDKRLLEAERNIFLEHSVNTEAGQSIISGAYRDYITSSGNPENISLEEFTKRVQTNNIQEPNKISFKTGSTRMNDMTMSRDSNTIINDPKDINTALNKVKLLMANTSKVQEQVNKAYTNEANSLWAYDDPSNAAKASSINKVKRTLKNNILAQNGVGYDIVGSSQRLSEVLDGYLTKDGEDLKVKGRIVEVDVLPLDRSQKGVTDEDLMYQFVIRDKTNGKTLKTFRVRPQDQGSHADLMYQMNKDLEQSFDANTNIGKNARTGIINYELPQFKVGETKRLLDAKVNKDSPKGAIGVASIIPVGNANFTVVKSKTPVVDHFTDDDPNHPVTVLQETYHIVRLRDNLPKDIVINEENVEDYLSQPGTIYDNGILNDNNIGTPNLISYGKTHKDAATAFGSVQDALASFYETYKK